MQIISFYIQFFNNFNYWKAYIFVPLKNKLPYSFILLFVILLNFSVFVLRYCEDFRLYLHTNKKVILFNLPSLHFFLAISVWKPNTLPELHFDGQMPLGNWVSRQRCRGQDKRNSSYFNCQKKRDSFIMH